MDIFKETWSLSRPKSKMKGGFQKNGASSPSAAPNRQRNRRLPQPRNVNPATLKTAPSTTRSCSFIRRCWKWPDKKALSSRCRRIRSRLQRLLEHRDLTSVIGIMLSDPNYLSNSTGRCINDSIIVEISKDRRAQCRRESIKQILNKSRDTPTCWQPWERNPGSALCSFC